MKNRERVLLSAVFLFWFSVYTYPSFLSSYSESVLGASDVMLGLIVGSYGFTQMILRIPLGIVSDMLKKRKLFVMLGFGASMLASAGLILVSVLAGHVSANLSVLVLVCRGISGVGASTWVTFSVLYSASYPPEQTGKAMSRLMIPQYFSQVAAMLLGAYIMNGLGTTWAFLLATVAGLAGLLIISRVKDIPPQGEGGFSLRAFASVVRDRDLITGTVLATIFHLVCWGTVLGFVQNWAKAGVSGFRPEQLGWLSVMYLLPNALIAGLLGERLARIFGRRLVLAAGFVIDACACALYPHALGVWQLMLTQGMFGVGMGMVIPITMTFAIHNIPDKSRGAAMGVYQAVYGLGMFLGPVISGAVIDYCTVGGDKLPGYIANFHVWALVSVIGALTAVLLVKGKAK